MYKNILRLLFRRFWVIPTKDFVPSDQHCFLGDRLSKPSWLFKCVKRYLFFLLSGQVFFEVNNIPDSAGRILWVNLAAPSLGDTLMDVSGRVFLSGREVHLLTHKKNKELFASDPVFSRVFTNAAEIDPNCRKTYNLVILDSYGPLTLLRKIRLTGFSCPYVGFYGFLNGYEIHRLMFSHARLAYLCNKSIDSHPIKPLLGLRNQSHRRPGCTRGRLLAAIAVGGEWRHRTYQHWSSVISGLLRSVDVLLVGSTNGSGISREIENQFPSVSSQVGKQTLNEVILSIHQCDLFIGADGGLWHVANALGKPSVVLFAEKHLFDQYQNRVTLATDDIDTRVLYDALDVSNISAIKVLAECQSLIAGRLSGISA
jgi:hypothetical protein